MKKEIPMNNKEAIDILTKFFLDNYTNETDPDLREACDLAVKALSNITIV